MRSALVTNLIEREHSLDRAVEEEDIEEDDIEGKEESTQTEAAESSQSGEFPLTPHIPVIVIHCGCGFFQLLRKTL